MSWIKKALYREPWLFASGVMCTLGFTIPLYRFSSGSEAKKPAWERPPMHPDTWRLELALADLPRPWTVPDPELPSVKAIPYYRTNGSWVPPPPEKRPLLFKVENTWEEPRPPSTYPTGPLSALIFGNKNKPFELTESEKVFVENERRKKEVLLDYIESQKTPAEKLESEVENPTRKWMHPYTRTEETVRNRWRVPTGFNIFSPWTQPAQEFADRPGSKPKKPQN